MPTASHRPLLDPRQRYSITEAIDLLRTSRRSLYIAINRNEIATIKVGRRRFVPGSEIERLSAAPVPQVQS